MSKVKETKNEQLERQLSELTQIVNKLVEQLTEHDKDIKRLRSRLGV